MPKKAAQKPKPDRAKRPRDVNQLAHSLIREMTDRTEDAPKAPTVTEIARVMKELGRRGGKVGGKNRMAAMSEEERSDLASKAAHTRWAREKAKR